MEDLSRAHFCWAGPLPAVLQQRTRSNNSPSHQSLSNTSKAVWKLKNPWNCARWILPTATSTYEPTRKFDLFKPFLLARASTPQSMKKSTSWKMDITYCTTTGPNGGGCFSFIWNTWCLWASCFTWSAKTRSIKAIPQCSQECSLLLSFWE